MKKSITKIGFGCLLAWGATAFQLPAQTFVYNNLIPIPDTTVASWPSTNVPGLDLYIRRGAHNFNPHPDSAASPFNAVETYYYSLNADFNQDNSFILGPTLLMKTGEWVKINQINELGGGEETTIHWHGMELPAGNDGGPHEVIPGIQTPVTVDWRLLDSAATFWYHPHLHNATLPQVQKGLSGMIRIDDSDAEGISAQLPHTYGVDDIPLIIGDVGFTNTSSVSLPLVINPSKGSRPYNVVNGVMNPYYTVPKGMVRLRILNGSTRKAMRFAFSQDLLPPGSSVLLPMYLVADDGGYAMHGVDQFDVLTIGPGARREILVDLTQATAGHSYYLRNLGSTLGNEFVGGSPGANSDTINGGPNGNGGPGDVTRGPAFLRLEVTNAVGAVQNIPTWIRDWADLGLGDNKTIDFKRTKYLVYLRTPTGGVGAPPNWPKDLGYVISDNTPEIPMATPPNPTYAEVINFQNLNTFDIDMLNDVICVPSTEEWTIENRSDVAHPFHIHKIFFRIKSIDYVPDWGDTAVHTPLDVRALGLDAPKDDVLILPHWRLKWIGNFDDYGSVGTPPADSGMMYHCHILTHEDYLGGGMMHQFAIQKDLPTSPCTPLIGRPEQNLQAPASTVFPNPTENDLYLQGSSTKPSTVRIFDYMGRLLNEQTLEAFEGTVPLDITGMPRGLLLVEWTTVKGKAVKKVLKR